jgi:hypothetical protein
MKMDDGDEIYENWSKRMRAVKVRFCSKRQINKTKQKMRNKRLAFD